MMMSVLGPLVLLYLISVTAADALLFGGPKNSPIARSGARPLKPRIYELHRLSADRKRIDSARIGRKSADSRQIFCPISDLFLSADGKK